MNTNLFINLITIANSSEIFKKYSMTLNTNETNFIQRSIKEYPDFFNQIFTEINTITADIPNIVLIVSKISNFKFKI